VTADRTADRFSLAVEHLQNAVHYAQRGSAVFFDEANPDTRRLVEAELRKSFESLNRQGNAFYNTNPSLDRARISEIRQLLTHDYTEIDADELWRLVTGDAPRLLRLLARAKLPKQR
jgi:uncharacterized protein with HEPN domain